MKELFLILLFGKNILLTPTPVVLDGMATIIPDKPLTAITAGASLQIDVSSLIVKKPNEGIPEFRKRVKTLFPPNIIKAVLLHKSGKKTELTYTGSHIFNDKSTVLSLYSETRLPLDTEFIQVSINSTQKLDGVLISWKNYKK